MSDEHLSDDALRAAYTGALSAKRSSTVPAVSLEQIHALAQGTYIGADRNDLLETILAHPETAREFHTLAQVAALKPNSTRWFAPRVIAAAAMLVVAVGIGSIMRMRSESDTLRSAQSSLELVSPATGAAWTDSTPFEWRSISGATQYRVDVIDADGTVVATATTSDTLTLIARTPLTKPEYQWYVTTSTLDGVTHRSQLRSIRP